MPSPALTRAKNTQIRKLTPEELKDRRERGLCFNCHEKFVPGHKCAKLLWLELRETEEDALSERGDTEISQELLRDVEAQSAISLQAITEAQGPRTYECTIRDEESQT
jgi:hypothetical protein